MPKNINNIISSGLNIFKKRPDRIAYVIFVVSSIFYLMQISKAELNGDCATYAGIIEDKNLNVLPVHFGFYLVGILFNKILPFKGFQIFQHG